MSCLWKYCGVTIHTTLWINFLCPKVDITVCSFVHFTKIVDTTTARCQFIPHPILVSYNMKYPKSSSFLLLSVKPMWSKQFCSSFHIFWVSTGGVSSTPQWKSVTFKYITLCVFLCYILRFTKTNLLLNLNLTLPLLLINIRLQLKFI